MRASPRRERLPLLPLLALAAATFASITIEMLPTAVMPEMARELGVSHARIGALMSVYALTVVVTAAPLTHVTARIPRRALLTGVLVAYGIATIVTAAAPSYELVLASRVAGGTAHGVFWAITASYTASILPAGLLARGLSITLGGGSAAFVLGVPFSAQLAQAIGWRASCGVLALITLTIAVLLWCLLPRPVPGHGDALGEQAGPVLQREAAGSGQNASAGEGPMPSVAAALTACALASLVMTGQYAVASYISPIVTGLAAVPESWLGPALLSYGLAGAIATFVTGHLFGRRLLAGLLTALALMAAGAGMLGVTGAAGLPAASFVALGAWGAGMGFAAPVLQARLLAAAPPGFRDIAAALYTSGFNIGIASGAFIGGVLLEAAGLAVLPAFLAVVLACAAGIILVLDLRARRGWPVRPRA